MAKSLVILGSGGHARVVADACRAAGRNVLGFLDPKRHENDLVAGWPVLGGDELLDDPRFVERHEFLVGIGAQRVRRRLGSVLLEKGTTLATIVHPHAVIAHDARVGKGTVLVAASVVNSGAVVGNFVIINTGATVDHDNVLEDGVHICPGAHLAGTVTCGENAFIGTGAIVIPNRHIGAGAIIGAGAVVTVDIPADVVATGCPARIVRKLDIDR